MSVRSRKRSQFRSLFDDEDGKRMTNGQQSHFIVSYMGETTWSDEFMYVDDILKNLLPKQMSGKFWLKKQSGRKVCLFIDICSKSVFVQSTQGISENCFKFCNIREVIYCGNIKQYAKYLVLVVNGELESGIKAHIFSCGSIKEAKKAYKIFTDTFTHVSVFDGKVQTDKPEVFDDEITCSRNLSLEIERQDSLSEGEQTSPEVEEPFVEKAFTAFARSRSFNSGKRYAPGSGQNLLRPYSLPAREKMQTVTGN